MTLQQKVLKYLNQRRIRGDAVYVVKVQVANERGCPDILCCVNGRFLAIEVKTGRDTVKPAQKVQLDRIDEANGEVMIVNDFKQFELDFEVMFYV